MKHVLLALIAIAVFQTLYAQECENLRGTTGLFSENDVLNSAVQSELGADYSVADWNDLKDIVDMDSWISCMGLQNDQSFNLLRNGSQVYTDTRQYFMRYCSDGDPGANFLVHDQIGSYIFLGSWTGSRHVLAKKVSGSADDGELIAYYPFNGNAHDESGNGYDGTSNGGIEFVMDRSNNSGSAIQLDGIDDWIVLPNLQIRFPWSISFWTGPLENNEGLTFISDRWDSYMANYYGFRVTVEADGKVSGGFGDGHGQGATFTKRFTTIESVIGQNDWYHVVITYSDYNTVKIFVDNAEIETEILRNTALSSVSYQNEAPQIGADDYSNGRKYWKGKLDDIKIYNYTLSPSEISQLYNEGSGGCIDCETGTVTDDAGNTYNTVKIGDQWWMAENLAYLPSVSPAVSGSYTVPYYYVYSYNGTDPDGAKLTTNYNTYGVLYNWAAAQEVCPSGWHLPADDEFKQLETYLGLSESELDNIGWRGTDEGALLKSTTGWNNEANGSNTSGFDGRPAGGRTYQGAFKDLGDYGSWWSSSAYSSNHAWNHFVGSANDQVGRTYGDKKNGLSVRCVKDEQIANININVYPEGDQHENIMYPPQLPVNHFICLVGLSSENDLYDIRINGSLEGNPLTFWDRNWEIIEDGLIEEVKSNKEAFIFAVSDQLTVNKINIPLQIVINSINNNAVDFKFSDDISILFAQSKAEALRPYSINKDAYAFMNNEEYGVYKLDEYYYDLAELKLNNTLLIPFKYLFASNGKCYGMAASSGSYFKFPEYKPLSGYPKDWNPPNMNVKSNITSFHLSQNTYNFFVSYNNPNEKYEKIFNELLNGNPSVIGLKQSGKISGGHAVLVVKITEFKSNPKRYLELYDPNWDLVYREAYNDKQLNSFTYNSGVEDGKGQTIIYDKVTSYPQLAFIINDIIEDQTVFNDNFANYLIEAGEKIFASACPINIYVENTQGFKSGYLEDGTFINEIPGAEVSRIPTFNFNGDSITFIYVPSDDDYSVNMYAIDEGDARFEYYKPLAEDEHFFAICDSIKIIENTIITFHDTMTSVLEIDNNGDGEVDYTEPTYESHIASGISMKLNRDKVSIYPNPSQQYLHIEPDSQFNGTIEIYDAQGMLILTEEIIGEHQHRLDVSHLKNGIYYYRMVGDQIRAGKFLKYGD